MKLKHSILSAIVLFAVGLQAEGGEAGAIQCDVVYKTTPQGPLKLDLHYPESPKPGAKYPLVLFTHGVVGLPETKPSAIAAGVFGG